MRSVFLYGLLTMVFGLPADGGVCGRGGEPVVSEEPVQEPEPSSEPTEPSSGLLRSLRRNRKKTPLTRKKR